MSLFRGDPEAEEGAGRGVQGAEHADGDGFHAVSEVGGRGGFGEELRAGGPLAGGEGGGHFDLIDEAVHVVVGDGNGTSVQILTKYPLRLHIPSLLEEALQFERQSCICFSSIETAQLLAHVRRAAHR